MAFSIFKQFVFLLAAVALLAVGGLFITTAAASKDKIIIKDSLKIHQKIKI